MSQPKPDIKKANPCPPCPTNVTFIDKLVYWLGIGLGSGLPKRAPGTWGTLGGLILAIIVFIGFKSIYPIMIMVVLGLALGSWICGRTSDLMDTHDNPHIVFDEWVGMWIALLPFFALYQDYPLFDHYGIDFVFGISLAFILFRIFDIIKPFPISWADRRVSGGFGIMLDDILAGIMAAIGYTGITALIVIGVCGWRVC